MERLQARWKRLQDRIEAMYEDKLDGRVDGEFFDRKAGEWRAEQARLREQIVAHERADQSYMEFGFRLLDVAQNAPRLFMEQTGSGKGDFLRVLLSNCSWRDGKLQAEFREAFALLAVTNERVARKRLMKVPEEEIRCEWSGRWDCFARARGLVLAPLSRGCGASLRRAIARGCPRLA